MYPTRIEIEEIFLKTFNINTNLHLSGMRNNKTLAYDARAESNKRVSALSQDFTQTDLPKEDEEVVNRILEEAS